MIKNILTYYASLLDEYLRPDFPQPEGVAEVGFVGSLAHGSPNKLLVSLFGIERETAGGISPTRQSVQGETMQGNPPLYINLNVLIAAVYDEKRYPEALSVLSGALLFVQSHSVFTWEGKTYTLEMVTPSPQDLNNIWTSLGGQYHPSVVCKLRRLTFDAGEIRQSGRSIDKPVIEM